MSLPNAYNSLPLLIEFPVALDDFGIVHRNQRVLTIFSLKMTFGKSFCHGKKIKWGLKSFETPLFISLSACTGGETRTPDTWFWRPVLYQLSYTRVYFLRLQI